MQELTRIDNLFNKIVEIEEAVRRVGIWRNAGLKVGFTNGCFDILHEGHVRYLTSASEKANRLIVAINSDESVKRLGKGENRPINNEKSRQLVMAAMSVADIVIIFNEDTPLELIKTLKPDVVIKGGDYDAAERNPSSKSYIVGADVMDATGGEVATIPFVDGFSTTSIIEKINQ